MSSSPLRGWLIRLGREPFVHFLLIGVAIFAFNALRGRAGDAPDRRIVVSQSQAQRLVNQWMQTWHRPPSPQEIDGAIRDYVKEEIYYREALRLGLDKDDEVVRRRMRAKMEFLAVSQLELQKPTDAMLQSFLDAHAAQYSNDARYSFDQVYVTAREGDAQAMARARNILGQLNAGKDWRPKGDPVDAPASMVAAGPTEIARVFGPGLVDGLRKPVIGRWVGPVTSGLGLHLLRVRAVDSAAPPRLADVRQVVENDWRATTLAQREADGYQALLNAYDVRIERPK